LGNLPIKFIPINKKGDSNYWLSVLTINDDYRVTPEQIILELESRNIESRPVWKPMSLQELFKGCTSFSHTEEGINTIGQGLFNTGVCLPSGSTLTNTEQQEIIELIKKLF
jgi:pyridoxal phosphate-dependent aminotransferase EpsN